MRYAKFLLALTALAGGMLFTSCRDQRYETVDKDRIFDSWGVSNDTYTFGEFDSLYYAFNPIRNINDSIYYNGNYTDSYYDADSTRVTLRYTTADSIVFNIDRMYSVEVNPRFLIVTAKAEGDTASKPCTLRLVRDVKNGKIYKSGPDREFARLLATGTTLQFLGTNASSTWEPQGDQNYEFILDAEGFRKAIELADSLNLKMHNEAHGRQHSDIHHNIFDALLNPHQKGHKEESREPEEDKVKEQKQDNNTHK